MFDVHVTRRQSAISTAKPKIPRDVRIRLSVCPCYNCETIIFVIAKAEHVARILDITMKDLECAAATAMFTGKPEVVACYKQRDLAEAKLVQLEEETPFIARSCHSFDIVDEH